MTAYLVGMAVISLVVVLVLILRHWILEYTAAKARQRVGREKRSKSAAGGEA